MIIVTPAWQSQAWYRMLLKIFIKNPILLPIHPKSLVIAEGIRFWLSGSQPLN